MTAVQQETAELVVTIRLTTSPYFPWQWTVNGRDVRQSGTAMTRIGARWTAWRFCRRWARHHDDVETWRFTREPVA